MATSGSMRNELNAALTQVFKVTVPEDVTGMYATSIELFLRKKSKSYGLELNIVELTDGQPDTSKAVPNSNVRVKPEAIQISETGTAATKFTFPQPVFLSDNTRYAFVLRALGGAPEFEIWTGINGRKDISTGKTISSNPLSEQSYFAKSTSDWAEIPNEDIKYRLYRAKFKIESASRAGLKKGPTEILRLKNVKYSTGYPDFRAGDEVFGRANNGLQKENVYAKVVQFDPVNNMLYLNNSTGLFAVDDIITVVRSTHEGLVKPSKYLDDGTVQQLATSGTIATAEISELFDFPAHAIVPKIGGITNSLGAVSFEYRGTYKEGDPKVPVKETANNQWKAVINKEELDFQDKTRYMLCRSSEVAGLSGNTSVEIRATLSSNNNFISPILDLRERSVVAIRNLINANTANESGDYGAASTKYISKTITLADGQEAEDLKVYVTAYKPSKTLIYVYAKVWNAEDSEDFDKKKWSLMKQVTESTVHSDPKNAEDYREFEFDMPVAPPVAGAAYSPNVVDPVYGDPVQYTGPDGIYVGFKKYAIKVVMAVRTDDDAYDYPRLNDVRAIALQK